MAQNLDLLISHDVYNEGLSRRNQRIVDRVGLRITKNAERVAATFVSTGH